MTPQPKREIAIAGWVRKRLSGYTPMGKFWIVVGVTCMVVDMAIGFLAGSAQATFWHGVGYATLAIGFACLPEAAYDEFEQGRWVSAVVVGLLCIPIGVKAYEQQLTYSAGMRTGEVQMTRVQNAKYDGAQDGVKEAKTNLVMWQKQLADLQSQAPWAATVKAEALRDERATLDKRIADEIAGKRGRASGCKAECEKLQNERKIVNDRIAAAEQMADLKQRIDATERVIAAAREKADKTEHKSSLNLSVAETTAQIAKLMWGAKPEDAVAADDIALRYATLGSAGLGSLALLIMAPVGIFLGNRRRVEASLPPIDPRPMPAPMPPSVPPNSALMPVVHHTKEYVVDPRLEKWLQTPEYRNLFPEARSLNGAA
jgi:hypothetical protein